MQDVIGRNIGRYHVIEKSGRGGMATVYKAFDTNLEREVAIKLIRRRAFSQGDWTRTFRRFEIEAKSLARLDHPNIVRVYDYGEFEGAPFIVMELLDDGSLKQRLGRPIPVSQAAAILAPIADGLAYAHRKGILHRDVKPSNILFKKDGTPVLTDFGIAKIIEGSNKVGTITKDGVGVGTPEYMAPEQGSGRPIDGRTDEYSLGIVFYEMITGQKPYTADTPLAVILKQQVDPLPRPMNVSIGAEKLLYKALAKNPDDRFRSIDLMADAFERLIHEDETSLFASLIDRFRRPATDRASAPPTMMQGVRLEPASTPSKAAPKPTVMRGVRVEPSSTPRKAAPKPTVMHGVRVEPSSAPSKAAPKPNPNPAMKRAPEAVAKPPMIQVPPTPLPPTVAARVSAPEPPPTIAASVSVVPPAPPPTVAVFNPEAYDEDETRDNFVPIPETNMPFDPYVPGLTASSRLKRISLRVVLPALVTIGSIALILIGVFDYRAMKRDQAAATVTDAARQLAQEETQAAFYATATSVDATRVIGETLAAETALAYDVIATQNAALNAAAMTTTAAVIEPTAAAPVVLDEAGNPLPTATPLPNNPYAGCRVGDFVQFGRMEQDAPADEDADPIDWVVLDVQGGKALLLSVKALDVQPFNSRVAAVDWDKSELRAWLNGIFKLNSFSAAERLIMLDSTLVNAENKTYGTTSGSPTVDQIFLLSAEEAEHYYRSDASRLTSPSEAAAAKGGASQTPIRGTNMVWWLRTSGRYTRFAAFVTEDGRVNNYGALVTLNYGVRPAVWIDTLKSIP